MIRPRFSLATLVIVFTVLALFLGYSQVRRQRMLRKAEEIKSLGGVVMLPNGYWDILWQREPAGGFYGLRPVKLREEKEIRSRMKALGVEEPTVFSEAESWTE